jgi:hypothetical protein
MKKEIENELMDLDSSLAAVDSRRIYEPGDVYFKKMQAEVFAELTVNKQKRNIFKLDQIRISGIAAAVLLLVSVYLMFYDRDNSGNEIARTEAYEYLNENLDYVDDNTIIQYIDESDLVLEDESFPDNSSIEAYLEENPENYEDLDIDKLF